MEKFFSKIRVTRGFEHKLSKYLGDSVCVCVGGGGGGGGGGKSYPSSLISVTAT